MDICERCRGAVRVGCSCGEASCSCANDPKKAINRKLAPRVTFDADSKSPHDCIASLGRRLAALEKGK